MGQYNVGTVSSGGDTIWHTQDPLLELGNGISGTPSDALVVYKSGNLTASGTITATGMTTSGTITASGVTTSEHHNRVRLDHDGYHKHIGHEFIRCDHRLRRDHLRAP